MEGESPDEPLAKGLRMKRGRGVQQLPQNGDSIQTDSEYGEIQPS
jgi:hypothetical protein